MGPHRILLDCGLKDLSSLLHWGQAPADWVFCSHAHEDHGRGLRELHQAFPALPIYSSETTAQLLPLLWSDEKPEPNWCQGLSWQSSHSLAENLTLKLIPAGHLPGAALSLFTYTLPTRTYRVLYTGDFCLSHLQLVEGVDLQSLRGLAPDLLIIESTLGDHRHPHRRQQEKHLLYLVEQAIVNHRSVLLPLPPLGLGQDILKLLRSHHQFTGRELDIWVHGSMVNYCNAYLERLAIFPLSVQNFAKHQPLFWDEKIYPHLRPLTEIPFIPERPSVVLTTDWRSLWPQAAPFPGYWTVLCAEAAPPIPPLPSLSQLKIETYTLSDHSDGRNTTQLIHNLRPQHIIFVHGSSEAIQSLTSLEELQSRYQLHSPQTHTWVELPIGDRFVQPSLPVPVRYEGEVNEQNQFISLTLDKSIVEDPRWLPFADTGLIEARWLGEELVLRGISQQELRRHPQTEKRLEDLDCCLNCCYYQQQRCLNGASPLAGLLVTPDGYCPVFESES